jgi:uncharacterized integral membrane protein
MWRKLVLALIVVPLALVLVTLAVVNRAETTLILDPFGGSEGSYALHAPFFLFLLGAFALGLVVGGTATWFRQGKWRRTAREGARETRELRLQTDRLERELEGGSHAHGRPRLAAD